MVQSEKRGLPSADSVEDVELDSKYIRVAWSRVRTFARRRVERVVERRESNLGGTIYVHVKVAAS